MRAKLKSKMSQCDTFLSQNAFLEGGGPLKVKEGQTFVTLFRHSVTLLKQFCTPANRWGARVSGIL